MGLRLAGAATLAGGAATLALGAPLNQAPWKQAHSSRNPDTVRSDGPAR
jgi:hypothetical protein